MQELTNSMNYTTAVHIGNIHQYLWETIENSATGMEKLAKRLKTKTKNSLLYVCADLNRFPRDHPNRAPPKDDLIALLVDWRLTQPLDSISWTPVDSPAVLKRIQLVIHETIVPSHIVKPPRDTGLPSAGTPKADTWRYLFAIFLPLALLSIWQQDSPIAAADAEDMSSVLATTLYLTCAASKMVKRKSTLQDRMDFRTYLQRHIDGLKNNFPGFIQPSHHLAFHIFEGMDLFSTVYNTWCFPGERLILRLRGIPVNHKIGEFEGTLLHSFCKGSAFRHWLLQPDCPPLLKYCAQLIDKTYSFKTDTDPGQTSMTEISQVLVDEVLHSSSYTPKTRFSIPVPRDLLRLLGNEVSRKISCYSRISTHSGRFYGTPASEGNSYICFYPAGDRQNEWIAGQIQHIFKQDGLYKFSIRRSLPQNLTGDAPDPFKAFWDCGFEAKMVSSMFSDQLEVVNEGWVVSHVARWILEPHDIAVCLRLDNDECSCPDGEQTNCVDCDDGEGLI